MKKTFNFLTLSRVFNDCRDSVGRLSTLFLLLFALSFGFNQEVKANFPANKVFYFDASGNTNWTSANFNVKFNWHWDSGTFNTATWSKTKVPGTDWIYYTTSPNTDYNNGVQICRMNPNNDGDQWNYTNQATGNDRGNNNCLYCESGNSNWWDTWVPCWKTYVPPMKSLSIANNGTTTVSGSGSQSDPYIIAAGATIKVTATAALQVDDSNPTFKYEYSVDGAVVQDYGSGNNTYQFTAGTEAHTYAVTVRAYATYNSVDNSAIDGGNTIYFKVPSYTITYDPATAPTGCAYTTTPTTGVYGSSISMTIAPTDGYTIAVSAKNSSTSASISLSKSDNTYSFTMPASNVAVTVTPTETLHTVSVVCKDAENTQIGTGDDVTGVGIATSKDVTAPTIAGYTFDTWVLTDGVTSSSTLTNATISIKATADGKTITAKYTKDASFSLQVAKGTHVTAVTGDQNPVTLGNSYPIAATAFDNGYEFNNWTASPSENASFVNVNAASTNVTVNNGSVIVTANAKATTYTIEYVLPEGVTTTNPASYTIESATITLTNPSNRTGYDFAGWTCEGNPITEIAQGSTGNKTITATWTAQTYTITYKDQNNATFTGSWPTPDAHPTTHTYDTETQLVSPTRVGYTFAGWFGNKECIGDAMTSIPATAYTANFTLYAKWTAKQYTISFDQNGGTGGQTATVTATFDAAMPALSNFTAPTRVGYKFNGYWDAASNGTKYYNADGTSANNWDKDANTTLYAQWTQLNVYIEGRFSVATNKTRTEWLHTGSNVDDWELNSTNIKMTWDGTNNRYYLNTWATLKELSDKHGSPTLDFQFFNFKQCENTSIGSATEYNYGHEMPAAGEHVTMTKGGESAHAHFNVQEQNGYVILYFNEAEMWYEIQPFEGGLFDVEFSNGGGGGTVTPSGTKKTGEVSWTVTANPSDGYSFAGWTLTGGAKAEETDEELKTYYTIHVTATGDGKAIANFKIKPKIYFQTCQNWGNDVYVYFYKGDYWNNDKGTGNSKSGNCISDAIHMTYTGENNIHYAYYDVEDLRSKGMDSHIAFTNNTNVDNENFFKNVNVVWRGDFYPCDNPLFVADGFDYSKNDCGYYKGHWSNMIGDDADDYLMMASENWKPNENMRFKKDNNGNWIVIKNYSGFANDYHDEFQIWRNCDGNWYGCGQTDSHNQNITSDISGWKLYANTSNIDITPWKEGDYEFKWNPNSQELSVTYLGDITVANFPGEVSTFVNRQHKVQPDVTLRNGTSVTDVKILVEGHELPYETAIATYEQNGTNLVITGNAIGTDDNLTVRYQNNKQEPYIVDRTLKVNVATPIVIQAMLSKDEDDDESTKDDYWSNTGLMHIHFWGSDDTKTQDMAMSYNKDTKVFSVTAPKIDDFKFLFWYGEDINLSANEAWRKTQDIEDCEESTCYSISYGISKTETRTATPKSGLCTTNEYYVEITMKDGNTYKSNTIDELTDTVSFFAPNNSDEDQYKTGSIRIVHNGAVSDPVSGFTEAGVYVATINRAANGFDSKSLYTGKYYIRTDGAAGGWNEYKNADNELVEFTRRANKNESYSYYWVKNLAKSDKKNVKADVANDYNDNLAGMIENDKFTDGGGFIYQSTNGANVRFSYEPTTNEFKRAIIGGSSDNNFLNIYSKDAGRLYADKEGTKELNENADLLLSKFNDVSDWVYEKVVYAQADGSHPTSVVLKSVYNGQTSHLLGYNKNAKGEDTDDPKPLEVLGEHTNTGTYALRISYDYKRNRLMASWEPGDLPISSSQIIDADVLFIQKEDANGLIDDVNVAQITYTDAGITAKAKLTSLKNIMYILEVTPTVIPSTSADNQLYWFSLPFNCNINDIFGVEDYVTLDANGQATAGTWGIQRYDGATRASHGWFEEDNPEGFWKWMRRNETMHAGEGYVVVFDKTNAASWPSIGVEEPCEEGDGCEDGKKTVQQKIKRLYFPSVGSKFEISYSGESSSVTYTDNPCNVEKRREYDDNWKVIGPMSYNNIGVDNTKQDNLTFYYTYNQSAEQGHRYSEKQTITGSEKFKSFHGYMTQFGGDLTWKPFTKSEDVTLKAPLYTENSEFQGGLLTIELNDAQGKELNHTFINLSKNGTTGFDQNLDLTKITENCAQIASVSEDVLYAGNTLPLDIETVPLNVKVVANGTYDIALEQSLEGLEVRLYDAFEQTTTPLDMMSATITLDKGEYKDRFFLQLKQKSGETPTSFDGKLEQYNLPTDKTQKLLINDQIYLINAGRIYNATGAALY